MAVHLPTLNLEVDPSLPLRVAKSLTTAILRGCGMWADIVERVEPGPLARYEGLGGYG